MKIPAYIKYLFFATVTGTFIIYSIFAEKPMLMVIAIMAAILTSRVACPNCGEPIFKDKNGWYLFTLRSKCRHCGFDTMLEPDGLNEKDK